MAGTPLSRSAGGPPGPAAEPLPVPPLLAELERRGRIAQPILLILAALFAWWGWQEGAYFGDVFYPVAMGVFALVALLALMAPFTGQVTWQVRLAAAGLGGLAVWTLVSGLWSPTPGDAVDDSLKTFVYLALFVIGAWTVHLLGRRMLLAVVPIAVAGAVIALITMLVLLIGSDYESYLHPDSTLRLPLGYRNGNAAFFLICCWPLLLLATELELRWQLRALAVGSITALLELAVLSQSRGSLPAAALAVTAFIAMAPHSLRAGAVFAIAAIPVVPALPALLDVFQHGSVDAGSLDLLHSAAGAMLLTTGLSVLLAGLVLRVVYPRLRLGARRVRILTRVSAVAAIIVAVGGAAFFVAERGGPVEFLDQRVNEFREGGDPDFYKEGQRFGANVGSNRGDFWRVALDEGARNPVIGAGAGGFAPAYVLHRDSVETPDDPHSLELLLFSELGIVGLLLFALFAVGCLAGAIRSRTLGPGAAGIAAASFAAGCQWFLQASYDWFWHYPAITGAAMYLLGAAVGPALLGLDAAFRRGVRWSGAAVAGLLICMAVPLYLAERYINRALDSLTADARGSYGDLGRAADLDPLDAQPVLIEGAIAAEIGDRERAVQAFEDALGREEDSYAAHYFLAKLLLESDPERAREHLERALELNPLSGERGGEVWRLERKLGP